MMPGIFFIRIFETETGAAADRGRVPARTGMHRRSVLRDNKVFYRPPILPWEAEAAFGLGLASGSDCAGAVSGGAETAKASEFSGP